MTILGIETSCDETALALIETKGSIESGDLECRIIDSLINSQAELHSAYGGVYPSLAKREHGKNLIPLLEKILGALPASKKEAILDFSFADTLDTFRADVGSQNKELFECMEHAEFLKNIPAIDRIAVTEGPGLEPALWVGINFAKILGTLWNIPVIPINHMEGHIIGSLLESDAPKGKWQKLKGLPLPALALLISGGHTELVKIDGIGNYTILGQTKDDAVGEAFDKTARLLGLPYPGGPQVSKLATEARDSNIQLHVKLPRPMMNSGDVDFSFSGLKTAVLYAVRDLEKTGGLNELAKKGICREFEESVADVLDSKLRKAMDSIQARSIIIGGGVSANVFLRQRFETTTKEYGIPLFMPSRHISGDNALMIALAGMFHDDVVTKPLKAQGTKRL